MKNGAYQEYLKSNPTCGSTNMIYPFFHTSDGKIVSRENLNNPSNHRTDSKWICIDQWDRELKKVIGSWVIKKLK